MRFISTLTFWMMPLAAQTIHHLKASAQTVVVGYYDASTPPALKVKSGDIVEMETLGVTIRRFPEGGHVAPPEPAGRVSRGTSPRACTR